MGLVLVFTLVRLVSLVLLGAVVVVSTAVVNQKGPIMGWAAGRLLGFFCCL